MSPTRLVVAALFAAFALPAPAHAAQSLVVRSLSNRPALISGADALVAVDLPAGTLPARVRVTVDGRDVTSAASGGATSPSAGQRSGRTTAPSSVSPNPGLCATSHTCPSRSRNAPA